MELGVEAGVHFGSPVGRVQLFEGEHESLRHEPAAVRSIPPTSIRNSGDRRHRCGIHGPLVLLEARTAVFFLADVPAEFKRHVLIIEQACGANRSIC
jgi:hypothetical protein